MSEIGLNELGYDERLYILAFDHRGSFEKMVGDVANVPGAKRLIWEGFQRAVSEGAPKEFSGILVDDQYGPDVAREAKAGGYQLSMPVEKSGQNEFDFQHGDGFGEAIEQFDPDFSKVLVRYNPEGRRRDERASDRASAAALGVAARASSEVPVRAARAGRVGAAREASAAARTGTTPKSARS